MQNKNLIWHMRASQNDKAKITTLAKYLGVKESEAVRCAVLHSLATMPKFAQKLKRQKYKLRHKKMK